MFGDRAVAASRVALCMVYFESLRTSSLAIVGVRWQAIIAATTSPTWLDWGRGVGSLRVKFSAWPSSGSICRKENSSGQSWIWSFTSLAPSCGKSIIEGFPSFILLCLRGVRVVIGVFWYFCFPVLWLGLTGVPFWWQLIQKLFCSLVAGVGVQAQCIRADCLAVFALASIVGVMFWLMCICSDGFCISHCFNIVNGAIVAFVSGFHERRQDLLVALHISLLLGEDFVVSWRFQYGILSPRIVGRG
ncbi:hypothetical protein AcW1_003715 [Taiwanofungus camphoratus]|nr:hypothetical protein AcW1_003715 [Antrodia cinnamomea]